MFDKFYKELEANVPYKEKEYVDLSKSTLFNPTLLSQQLSNVSTINDKDLFELLRTNYDTILHEACSGTENSQDYLALMLDNRFLNIFTQAINAQYSFMNYSSKIYCNKIAYDYITSGKNIDDYTKSLMYNLSRIVNRSVIPGLIGIGLNEDVASYLALARYSSQKEKVDIKRLNFILITLPLELMTEQMIVSIYEKLFNSMTLLFETTMFDTSVDNIGTDSCGEIYSRISLALLGLLNVMPLESIRKVLISYAGDYLMLHHGEITRFSMHSIS